MSLRDLKVVYLPTMRLNFIDWELFILHVASGLLFEAVGAKVSEPKVGIIYIYIYMLKKLDRFS